MIWPLKNKVPILPELNSVGDFASRRSFYYHPGIDVYCDFGQEVVAIESGIITNIECFTGIDATPTSPWWNNTWSIMIEGASGSLGYCELKPLPHIKIGNKVFEGEVIANIIPVLKKEKGWGLSMLHFELYTSDTKEHVTWLLDCPKPDSLKNPRPLLQQIFNNINS